MIKANLLHLSYNMWGDTPAPPDSSPGQRDTHYDPVLGFNEEVWRECIKTMADAGMNAVLIDLGDAVRYKSHPEIAVDGAWPGEKLREELAFCRECGIEPFPKLNFSACHDAWLGEYSRCLSTPQYYEVCADLIGEICELFDGPELFHIGMDEEDWAHQKNLQYAVIRQGKLWWHDLNFYVERVEQKGSRAWAWSDVLWNADREKFAQSMPRSVVQSNWYYSPQFPGEEVPVALQAFEWLEEMGYDQIPTGSTWETPENYGSLVEWCRERIADDRLMGFMMADWRATTGDWRETHLEAIETVANAHEE
ncbi:MAG: Tat pathway signal protein [Planctomycetes bacterium]|nr:Tat pathway signal protein [Planctomycetota bacterium]